MNERPEGEVAIYLVRAMTKDEDPEVASKTTPFPEMAHDLVRIVLSVLAQSAPEEVRLKVATVITPLIKAYVLGYIHNLNQLGPEVRKNTDIIVDQICALTEVRIAEARKEEKETIYTWLLKLRGASASDSAFWEHLSASIRNTRRFDKQRQSLKEGDSHE